MRSPPILAAFSAACPNAHKCVTTPSSRTSGGGKRRWCQGSLGTVLVHSTSEHNSYCFEPAMRLTCICVQIELRSITALQLRERLLSAEIVYCINLLLPVIVGPLLVALLLARCS